MIAAISRMGSAAALARYLHGPGRSNEHTYAGRPGGAVIAGTAGRPGSGMGWAKDLHRAAAGASNRQVRRPIWHCSLRAAPGDRIMADTEWRQIAAKFTEAMGIEQLPWVAVRHGDDHIHLAVCRVADDGTVWKGSNDRRAAQQACTLIEADHRLEIAPRLRSKPRRGPDSQVRPGEHAKAQRTGRTPQRVVLAEKVIAVVQVTAGRGREAFDNECARVGIITAANVATGTGRISGYTFSDSAVPSGERLVFKASQLHKCLSWAQLAPVLDEATQASADPATVYPTTRNRLTAYAATWQRRSIGGTCPLPSPTTVSTQTGAAAGAGSSVIVPAGHYDADIAQAISTATVIRPGTTLPSRSTPPAVIRSDGFRAPGLNLVPGGQCQDGQSRT